MRTLRSSFRRVSLALAVVLGMHGLSHARGFLPPVNYATGTQPEWVVARDLNGDGNLDFAVANTKDNNVRIYLGEGDGTFLANQTLTVEASPVFIAAGDFNQDGRTDLATTNGVTISVLLNSTAGFFPAVTYSGGGVSLAAADFDKDGIVDLVSLAVSGNVIFLQGDGKGAFQVEGTYQAGSGSVVSMTAADFDGDGSLDLAVADLFENAVDIVLGNGDGSFQLPTIIDVGALPRAVTSGDLNRDGRPDLLISNNTKTISVLLGNGDGTFQSPVHYATAQFLDSAYIADFNGDGVPDAAVAASGPSNSWVSVLLGKGDGTFSSSRRFATGLGTVAVAVGDFNHDRALDIVAPNVAANNVSILMNSGGTFVTTTSSQNPAPVGQAVTFTVTVDPSLLTATPTGSVIFKDGANVLGTVALDPTGQASLTTSGLSLGTHSIKTKYSGDPNFNPSVGKVITQIIE